MTVLVTGGAGYIGSVTVDALRAAGDDVVVLDDLSEGHREAVDADVPFVEGRTGDRDLVRRVIDHHGVDACVHFAAFTAVGDSVRRPARYMENNVVQGIGLFTALAEAGVEHVVLSSTAAVYGEPGVVPIPETAPLRPTNPYGHTKRFLEQVLADYETAYGMRSVALRYFNAAGAVGRRGERHDPETHLIPNILKAARGEWDLAVFGDDYPTPDGTAVRDYVHVADLADAHVLALRHLREGGASDRINLGSGSGFSVLEVIGTAKRVTGIDIPFTIEGRRAGDPPTLVASSQRARDVLGWDPTRTDLGVIVGSAWEWMQSR
ncbi:MAG TPA: UDP-glucose 4-epimerase GalE [Acidimicrobiia bacterium]|nr:UDP-glucose 4-epimerase GalE [Acidimicrobiia bacterium]